MKDHPIFRYWKLFIAFPMFFGFSGYNVYCAYAYGEIIGSRFGDGSRSMPGPIGSVFALIIYIVMLTIFGAALVKITQFLLITLLAKPKPAPPSPPLPSHE
jgi:hypothetical protein